LKPRNRTCFHGRVDSERRTSKRTILAAAQAIHAADTDASTLAIVHVAAIDAADRTGRGSLVVTAPETCNSPTWSHTT
jgi:hypothetical protein